MDSKLEANELQGTTESPLTNFLLSRPESRSLSKVLQILGRMLAIRVLILTFILGLTTWDVFTSPEGQAKPPLVFWAIGVTYAISLLNVLVFRRLLKQKTLGYYQLSVDVLLATFAVYVTASPIVITLYLLIIIGAAMLFSRHGAVIIAAFSGICYALLATGVLPPPASGPLNSSPTDIFGVYFSLVAVALVSGYLTKQLEMIGSIANSTQKDLSDLSSHQEQLFADIAEGIITLDISSSITSINQAAKAIMGLGELEQDSYVGQPIDDVLGKVGVQRANSLFLSENSQTTPGELSLPSMGNGKDKHLSYTVRPLSNSEGSEIGRIVIFRDVSEVKNMEQKLSLHERMAELLARDGENEELTFQFKDVEMVGQSKIMERLFSLVDRVSKTGASVLVSGESGTGKELIAKAIHAHSERRQQPFVAINCGAIPENLIESELFGHKKGSFTGAVTDSPALFRQGHGGTVFLDEIGELPLHLQTKLLRVLQEKQIRPVGEVKDFPVDVRIIAATNRDLKKEINENRFREDLYYRLNVVNILVPPLRDRSEDIPLLVRHFVGSYCGEENVLPQVSPEALQLLMNYGFPGNIRELENIIERALVLGGNAILPEHLPDEVCSNIAADQNNHSNHSSSEMETEIHFLPIDLEEALQNLEKDYLTKALEQSGGVKKHAAELLGLNFRSFRYRLKKYGMGENTEHSSNDNSK